MTEHDESVLRLAAIVESSDDAIVSKDLNGIVTSWNKSAERMFGFTAEEMIGSSIRKIIPEDRQQEEDEVIARIVRGELVDHFETVRQRKDGSAIDVSVTVSPLRAPTGEILGASNITRDISDRKLATRRAELLAQVSAMLGSSLDYETTLKAVASLAVPSIADWCAVDMLTADGKLQRLAVAHVDPAKRDLAQTVQGRYEDPASPYTPSYVARTGIPTIVPHITDDMIVAAARGDRERIDLVRQLGLVSYICVPLVAHGRILGALSIVSAESGRHFTNADLELAKDLAYRAALAVDNARAYREAQQASRLKDEFLATLSHELRTPLNAILGYSRLLRSGMMQGDKRDHAVDTIERNATTLTRIVEDVLDVSRIISGKMRLKVQPVNVPAVVHEAIETVRHAAEVKNVRIQAILDPDAKPVSGDPDRLQQIVWNLLSNAVKFTPKGGLVQVRLARLDSHLEITVSDTGIGMEAEYLPHVFERFRQADSTTTREQGGLGLGLAITRHLVELHGGTVSAASAGRGLGSTFIVRLPVRIIHTRAIDDQAAESHVREFQSLPSLSGLHVLAVDDDADALSLMKEILERAGAEVSVVGSGTKALESILTKRPDVMVADVGMPGMDGYALMTQIRRSADGQISRIPAAAVTGYARSEDRVKSLQSGFRMHLVKPIDPAELITAVAALAGRAVV